MQPGHRLIENCEDEIQVQAMSVGAAFEDTVLDPEREWLPLISRSSSVPTIFVALIRPEQRESFLFEELDPKL